MIIYYLLIKARYFLPKGDADNVNHLLYLYNKALISRRIGDSGMLLFFAIGFAKLTIIFMPNLRFCLIQTCGLILKKYTINEVNQYGKRIH